MAKKVTSAPKSADPLRMVTSTHRCSFAHVDAPHAFKDDDGEDGTPKYSITLLIPEAHPDVARIEKTMRDAHAAEALSKFKGYPYTSTKLWKPLRDGDEYAEEQIGKGRSEEQVAPYRGHFYIKATSLSPVAVFDALGNEILDIREEIYSGCYVRCDLKIATFNKKSVGFSFFLNSVKKTKDGPRIGGFVADPNAFNEDEDYTDVDQLEGDDYEAPEEAPAARTAPPKPGLSRKTRMEDVDETGAPIASDDNGASWYYI